MLGRVYEPLRTVSYNCMRTYNYFKTRSFKKNGSHEHPVDEPHTQGPGDTLSGETLGSQGYPSLLAIDASISNFSRSSSEASVPFHPPAHNNVSQNSTLLTTTMDTKNHPIDAVMFNLPTTSGWNTCHVLPARLGSLFQTSLFTQTFFCWWLALRYRVLELCIYSRDPTTSLCSHPLVICLVFIIEPHTYLVLVTESRVK